jgi:hypothetical protein
LIPCQLTANNLTFGDEKPKGDSGQHPLYAKPMQAAETVECYGPDQNPEKAQICRRQG